MKYQLAYYNLDCDKVALTGLATKYNAFCVYKILVFTRLVPKQK